MFYNILILLFNIIQYTDGEAHSIDHFVHDAGFGWLENPKRSLLVSIGSWGKMATGKCCVITMVVEVRKYGS